jgi:membrane protein implicated in regulation of membrane protease activity
MFDQLIGSWWAWVILGFVLGILEVAIPGYIFLGFAVGAIATGILVGLGIAVPATALFMIFAAISVVAWILLRRLVGVRQGQVKIWDRDINDSP